MDQSATNQFRVAFAFLLKKKGRGAQTRLAEKQGIDQGYLNAIVKGRKPGSEKIRGKISAYFGIDYEEMLSLGRRILDGQENPEQAFETHASNTNMQGHDAQSDNQNGNYDTDISQKTEKGTEYILEKLAHVVEVLEANDRYSDLLAELIDVVHDRVKTSKSDLKQAKTIQELKDENSKLKDQMKKLASRFADLEAYVGGEEADYRKTG